MNTKGILKEVEVGVRLKLEKELVDTVNKATIVESLVKFEDIHIEQSACNDEIRLRVVIRQKPDDRIPSLLRTIDDFIAAVKSILDFLGAID